MKYAQNYKTHIQKVHRIQTDRQSVAFIQKKTTKGKTLCLADAQGTGKEKETVNCKKMDYGSF
jgi:hypothetical protein